MRHRGVMIDWTRILAILASFAAVVPQSRALVCYRCLVSYRVGSISDSNYEVCAKFNGSSEFYKQCPTSTFCMKRTFKYKLPNGTLMTTAERDCAPQTVISQSYDYAKREWVSEKSADPRIYTEGCFPGENRGAPNGPSSYCYCSSDYCNTSSPMVELRYSSSFLVILMFMHWNFSQR